MFTRKPKCVFQTAAPGYAADTDAVPWSRVAGAASAKPDGAGLDAALSWKLTAVMELTMMEVTFYTIYHIISLFSALTSSARVSSAECPFCSNPPHLCSSSLFLPFIPPYPRPAVSPAAHYHSALNMYLCVCLLCLNHS